MKEKFLNEAIIGNQNMLATYSGNGELQRLYFPNRDNRQYIDFFHTGVTINDSNMVYLHSDVNNQYKQYYDVDTNILNTEIFNSYFNLKVLKTEFVMLDDDALIMRYQLINDGKIDLNVKFYIHSKLLTNTNNMVSAKLIDGGLMQYAHDFSFSTFAKQKQVYRHQINNVSETINSGEINDKDYIGMSAESAISYDLGLIRPEEKKEIELCILIDESKFAVDIEKEINRIKKIDFNKEYNSTKAYWRKYLKSHNGLNLKESKNSYEDKIYEIYKRSILLFPLLTNKETGAILASPEVDEYHTRCGMYAYCWPRDGVFVAQAFDILKMNKEAENFYKVFCKKTQSKNGMWEQRYYTDGKLAPSWGYQIDETATIVCGVYQHYKTCKSEKFLKDMLPMCEKAIKFLKGYVEDWLNIKVELDNKKDIVKEQIEEKFGSKEEHKYHISYDLWEECEGIHLYSLASIYGAFKSILKIYKALGKNISNFENNRLKEEKVSKNQKEIEQIMKKIKEYINTNLFDEEKNSFVRNSNDKMMDISILGAVTPFKVFKPKDKKILNTIERINMSLRTYTGGYKRYEYDLYVGGNPWVISNLWMTLYYLESGEKKKAKETFDFVVKTAGNHNLLGEQIDNATLKPNWVIGLTWSHALFVIVLEKLKNK